MIESGTEQLTEQRQSASTNNVRDEKRIEETKREMKDAAGRCDFSSMAEAKKTEAATVTVITVEDQDGRSER